MRCSSMDECFNEIDAYFNGEKTGHFLLVNAENYDSYQEIRQRLENDRSKTCIYLSQNCLPNGLPDTDEAISRARDSGRYALIGLSQALMLRDAATVEATLGDVLGCSISGHCVILLDHCGSLLKTFMNRDIRLKNRVVLLDGMRSPLPKIRLANSAEVCIGDTPIQDFPQLLAYLESLTDTKRDEELAEQPTVTVVTQISLAPFHDSVYSITASADIYDALTENYPDIVGAVEKSYGADAQRKWLASRLSGKSSFSALVCAEFGSTANLSMQLTDVWKSKNKDRQWFLWLALKVFGEAGNRYLTLVLGHCDGVDSFVEHTYLDLAEIDISDPYFERYFAERKNLLEKLPEDSPLITKYCDKLVRYEKNEVFYLTDRSDTEKFRFMQCLANYDYTKDELDRAVSSMSESLRLYMEDFVFDAVNTKLSESDSAFRCELTEYFNEYKRQKLTNRVFPESLKRVEMYARSPRPYNKLPARSHIVSRLERKNMMCFFFDSLGVEYLSFILARCKTNDLSAEVSIGRCELPSITSQNKEFLQYFPEKDCKKIDELDEVKHAALKYDYENCKYPTHLFEELDVIDKHLNVIRNMLVQNMMEKALIVSDHGASRLAVIYSQELDSCIAIEEKGEHSGRCCKTAEDPDLPFAAYENGFAVLANYERFKGGRRADVEVHGGASLEEVLVPIITLTKRPENLELSFADDIILLKPRLIPELVLCSNIPLKEPRLCIDGEYYDGEFETDTRRVKFKLPKIKRKGIYVAEVYDGEKKLSGKLNFKAEKQTREVDLL